MNNKVPQVENLVNAFRARALERGRGRGNIDTVGAGNPLAADAHTSTDAGRNRKRAREASNIPTTIRSPGSILIPPTRPSPINLDSPPSADDVVHPSAVIVPAPEVSKSPYLF